MLGAWLEDDEPHEKSVEIEDREEPVEIRLLEFLYMKLQGDLSSTYVCE